MLKITLIASRPGVGKSSLAYEILKKESKNKKGFFISLENKKDNILKIIGNEYNEIVFSDKLSMDDIINFIQNNKMDFIIIDYLQLFLSPLSIKGLIYFINSVKKYNIHLYLITQITKKIPITEEPKTWHLNSTLPKIADEIIFLYIVNNKVVKKILNKEQIQEEEKQRPTLDRI